MNTAYLILLILVVLIFLFMYFVGTGVWVKVVSAGDKKTSDNPNLNKESRRDFLSLSAITLGGLGTAAFMWPFVKSMNPAEDTLSLGSTEVDLS